MRLPAIRIGGGGMTALYTYKPAAIFSADRRFRFELRRLVNITGHGEICWFMLNPSTADESTLDPTIRRCMDFSRRWGFRELRVVNLVPLRSTDPKKAVAYYRQPPFGPDYFSNPCYWQNACEECDAVVMAWGSHGAALGGDDAREHVCCWTDEAWVLGWTTNGQPKHPLYLRADTKPVHAEDDSRRWLR